MHQNPPEIMKRGKCEETRGGQGVGRGDLSCSWTSPTLSRATQSSLTICERFRPHQCHHSQPRSAIQYLDSMLALHEASSPRLRGALVPGRVGCGRAPSSVCRRATSTRAAYDRARTSDCVVDSCFARHCGLDASRPGAWSFTGDPRTPAVGTSLDASTRVPSTCTGSDRDRRESARERAIHEHSTVAHGRWTMQCSSDGEPPRTVANL